MTASDRQTDRDPDPRIERSRRKILHAAAAELAEAGYGAFTIEAVAARAGVGKSTIYRHWADRVALIADAFETAHLDTVPATAEGSPRDAVVRLLRHVADVLADPTFSKAIPALVEGAERDATIADFHHRNSNTRRQALAEIVDSGTQAGMFHPTVDPELAAMLLLAPLFYARLMTGTGFDPSRIPALVDAVLGPESPGDAD